MFITGERGVHVAPPPMMYVIKNDKGLAGSIYDVQASSRSRTQSDARTHNKKRRRRIQLIFHLLIKSHKTLTNICTAFVNSAAANSSSCQWWQETDDIITVPPTHSNPVFHLTLKAALGANGRASQERATAHNELQFVT